MTVRLLCLHLDIDYENIYENIYGSDKSNKSMKYKDLSKDLQVNPRI